MLCFRESLVFIWVFHDVTVYDVFHEFTGYTDVRLIGL